MKSNAVHVQKKRKSEIKNYRPVGLLFVISNVLECVFVERITEHLNKKLFYALNNLASVKIVLLLTSTYTWLLLE